MSTLYNIEALLSKNDLVEFAERAGAKFRKTGGELRSHCPIHGGKNPNAFAVWEELGKQKWKCFTRGCGVGDVVDFIQVWQQKSFKDAVAFLGGEIIADPREMERLARERHLRAVQARKEALQQEEARRKELQAEEKHLEYHMNLKSNGYFTEQWVSRGLDESWQNYFCLGGCTDFVIDGGYHTPTLTIPIMNGSNEVLNIKHRLLNPKNPKDKYRPERSGLGPFPYFLAYPNMGYDGDVVWVVEGEVKTMVLASINPEERWSYVGVPGMSQYKGLVDKLKGKNVVAVADPNAECEVAKFCKEVSGRMIQLPEKVDDLVVSHGYDGDWLRSMERQARRVR
jgi:hypothetical protein